jgi:hypothetical protein
MNIHRDVKVWGCQAWVHIPDAGKLDPRAVEAVFLGIDDVKKGYRLLRLSDRKIVVSRDVTFNETKFPFKQKHEAVKREVDRESDDDVDPSDVIGRTEEQQNPAVAPVAEGPPVANVERMQLRTNREPSSQAIRNIAGGDTEFATAVLAKRKFPKRGKKSNDPNEPSTRKQMLKHELADQYLDSEIKEYNALESMDAWEEVPESSVPPGKNITTIKTVYKPKYNPDGSLVELKSRMTARGFNLTKGVDYDEVFSAVPMLKSFRLCVAIAQARGYMAAHIDFSNAFINANLDPDSSIYVRAPEGFPAKPGHVLRLKKALYGLPNAPREWQQTLLKAFEELGFRPNRADTCVLINEELPCIVCYFVDDCALFYKHTEVRDRLVKNLGSKFKLKDLGDLSRFVNIIVERKGDATILHQGPYIRKVLRDFRMDDCNPADTPATAPSCLSKQQCPQEDEEKKDMEGVPYKQAVGALYYAANCTRPDISYSVNHCAQYGKNPGRPHWLAVKRILRYLRGAVDKGLAYRGSTTEPLSIEVYCDSDWGNNDDRRSRTGYVVLIQGGAVEWKSQLQKSVATSTCEAEYYSICEAVKEIMWLTSFLTELGIPFKKPVLYCDNSGAIDLSKHERFGSRSKHVSIKLAFVREAWKNGVFELAKVAGPDNSSDILTKATGPQVFSRHAETLMAGVTPTRGHTALVTQHFADSDFCDVELLTLDEDFKADLSTRESSFSRGSTPPMVRKCANDRCDAYLYWCKTSSNWITFCLVCGLRNQARRPTCSICDSPASIIPYTGYGSLDYREELVCPHCSPPVQVFQLRPNPRRMEQCETKSSPVNSENLEGSSRKRKRSPYFLKSSVSGKRLRATK